MLVEFLACFHKIGLAHKYGHLALIGTGAAYGAFVLAGNQAINACDSPVRIGGDLRGRVIPARMNYGG